MTRRVERARSVLMLASAWLAGLPAVSLAQAQACGDARSLVHQIQGSGGASPLHGDVVSVEGIVVGDFQGPSPGRNGFFLQEADADADADPATSEGLFVFAPSAIDVGTGDRVRVSGSVVEFFGLTELTDVTLVQVCTTGNRLPEPALPRLPVASLGELERVEGMRVSFPQALVIVETFAFGRFGELVLGSERRPQPTAVAEPGAEALALAAANALDRITLDDGRTSQNPDPALHPNGGVFDLANRFRAGDTLTDVTGVMDFAFGAYRVQPTEAAGYTVVNPRPEQPEDVGGDLTVASFNVLNYFTTLASAGPVCGPAQDLACRGAEDANELERQQDKLVAALLGLAADVVGLVEIENAPTDAPLDTLVGALNAEAGAGSYAAVATGPLGTDAIKVALLYRPARVTPVGSHAVLDASVDPRFVDTLNRPTLAQSFRDASSAAVFTAVVNHWKSKGSPCPGDPDLGDGQGPCNLVRKAAAEALVDWLATDPTGSGAGDFLILGDLNSYAKEDPIEVLVAAGYVDLVKELAGAPAYSFVFDGQLGHLDHALASESLAARVTGTTLWHVNADEPGILSYDTAFEQPAQQALYEPNAFRSSDHDPVRVGLAQCETSPPTLDVSVTPSTLRPPNHRYVTVSAVVTASDDGGSPPELELVSVTSNEPDDGAGDGSTVHDVVILDDTRFRLRAERSGTGTGRIYRVTYQATDACGNTATRTATVGVPLGR